MVIFFYRDTEDVSLYTYQGCAVRNLPVPAKIIVLCECYFVEILPII